MVQNQPSIDLSHWLRSQTRSEHLACEQTRFAQAMLHGKMSLGLYREHIADYWGLHAWLADRLERLSAPDFLLAAIKEKVSWLEEDGRRLDMTRRAFSPTCAPETWLTAAGWAYVMEGSGMGAMVLRPKIAQAVGEDAPLRFYTGHGRHTPQRFQAFRTSLNAIVPQTDFAKVAKGAKQAFEVVRCMFEDLSELETAGRRELAPAS